MCENNKILIIITGETVPTEQVVLFREGYNIFLITSGSVNLKVIDWMKPTLR